MKNIDNYNDFIIEQHIEKLLSKKYLNLHEFGYLVGYNMFDDFDFTAIDNPLFQCELIAHTNFFTIFYNDIFLEDVDLALPKKKGRIWKLEIKNKEIKEFYNFESYLTYYLIFKNKNIPIEIKNSFLNNNLKCLIYCAEGIIYRINYMSLEKYLDLEIFKFIDNLHEPLALNKYLISLTNSERKKIEMKRMFDLLRNSKDILLPYLKGNDKLLNLFPDNSRSNIEDLFDKSYEIISRYMKIKSIVYKSIFENEEVKCFFMDDKGVHREIIGFGKSDIDRGHQFFLFGGIVNEFCFNAGNNQEKLMEEPRQILIMRDPSFLERFIGKKASKGDVDVIDDKNKVGAPQKIRLSEVFQKLNEIFFDNDDGYYPHNDGSCPQEDKNSYKLKQCTNIADKLKDFKPQKFSLMITQKEHKNILVGSQIMKKLYKKGIIIASQENGGHINKTEMEGIIKQINDITKEKSHKLSQ